MHNLFLKFFNFLRSSMDLARILILLSVILLLLYWVENLTGDKFNFLNFATQFLDSIIAMGNLIFPGSITILRVTFEFKFLGGLIVLGIFYYLTYGCGLLINGFEDIYNTGRTFIRKKEEEAMNASFQRDIKKEQQRYKNYKVYIGLAAKQKFQHQVSNIDMEEQKNILNKFLIEKLSTAPVPLGNGFVYSFNNLETMDNTLAVLFKVLASSAPVNYVICIQVFGVEIEKEKKQFKNMINLNILNKIVTMPDTVFRYQANTYNKNETSCLGDFESEGMPFEIHEFREPLV